MFRSLTQHFPFRSLKSSSANAANARQKLKQALLFGVLLLVLTVLIKSIPSAPASAPPVAAAVSGDSLAASPLPFRAAAQEPDAPIGSLRSPGVVVAALILLSGIALAVYLRRGNAASPPSKNKALYPMASYSLTPDQSLQLIYCANEVLLLAVSDDGIRLLKTYSPDAFPADLSPKNNGKDPSPMASPASSQSFANVLQHYASQYARRHQS